MVKFSLWKQLKKRLRRSRRPTWSLGCLAAFSMLYAAHTTYADVVYIPVEHSEAANSNYDEEQEQEAGQKLQTRSVIDKLASGMEPFAVVVKRIYLCGEEQQTLGRMTGHETLRLLKEHPGWTAVLEKDGTVVMQQWIDDLSDACKESATFGVDKSGNLSLFDGPPKKEKVLRTFFQLDVNFMESSLPKEQVEQLTTGIRVTDKDEYNSVLSTFSDYAVGRSERVMKSTY
ncbi:forespore regulator of the sigma-K checkpoint [Paenibacillus phyllosphaerae]|uniref:Forespore regulator of the sigma-K checkpoint n=1 Tax=Paenibacillus phyllosphaerae TaxID=274593 RepID=A0A7W5FMB1_9BACL|nr:forespore regulator of the sigma-K checkpoint [Paenibacillus phyllosphaerae]